jgi:RNA polymerase sigma-70 factor (ECF subfamily)
MVDQHVIARIRNGDQQPLTEVYRAYRNDFIYWAVRNYGILEETARDVYQMAVVILYENIRSGKLTQLQSSLKTYLFGIGKNKIMEELAAQRKALKIQENFRHEPLPADSAEEKEELFKILESALQELGEPCRTVLDLYYYQNYGIDQIAEALNYKGNDSAKTQKYKCLVRLKKLFAKQKEFKDGLREG